MKFILFLSFIALSNLFGCGGCVDYGVPPSLTSSSLSKYASQEQKIHVEIEKLNAIIQNEILKTEKENGGNRCCNRRSSVSRILNGQSAK